MIKSGNLTDLDDYHKPNKLANDRFAFYYFSNTPGTINIANNIQKEKRKLENLMRIK